MRSDNELMKQYLKFGAMTDEELSIMADYEDELANLSAYSGAIFSMAVEKLLYDKQPNAIRAKEFFARIRDIASKLKDDVDVSFVVSECWLDLAFIVSEGENTKNYSFRLSREIRVSHSES